MGQIESSGRENWGELGITQGPKREEPIQIADLPYSRFSKHPKNYDKSMVVFQMIYVGPRHQPCLRSSRGRPKRTSGGSFAMGHDQVGIPPQMGSGKWPKIMEFRLNLVGINMWSRLGSSIIQSFQIFPVGIPGGVKVLAEVERDHPGLRPSQSGAPDVWNQQPSAANFSKAIGSTIPKFTINGRYSPSKAGWFIKLLY